MGILIKAPARRREGSIPPASSLSEGGETSDALHIREVVRITGLRREQLYMWQRRYGFPAPLRDPFGDRVYPPDQVARLDSSSNCSPKAGAPARSFRSPIPRCSRCSA